MAPRARLFHHTPHPTAILRSVGPSITGPTLEHCDCLRIRNPRFMSIQIDVRQIFSGKPLHSPILCYDSDK